MNSRSRSVTSYYRMIILCIYLRHIHWFAELRFIENLNFFINNGLIVSNDGVNSSVQSSCGWMYRERHKICPFLNLEMDDDWINYRVVVFLPNQTSCVSLYLICKEFERHKICPFLRLATDSKEKNCFASKILRYKFLDIFGGRGGGDRWSPFNSFWRYYSQIFFK